MTGWLFRPLRFNVLFFVLCPFLVKGFIEKMNQKIVLPLKKVHYSGDADTFNLKKVNVGMTFYVGKSICVSICRCRCHRRCR